MKIKSIKSKSLKNSAAVIYTPVSQTKLTPQFWGKCAALCALLVVEKAGATPPADPVSLPENAHSVTSAQGGNGTQTYFPPVRGGTAPYTYSLLDTNGNVMSGNFYYQVGDDDENITIVNVTSTGSTGVPSGNYNTVNAGPFSTTATPINASYFTTNGTSARGAVTYMVRDANGSIATDTFQIGYETTLLTLSEYQHTYPLTGFNLDTETIIALPTITDASMYRDLNNNLRTNTYTYTILDANGTALYDDIGNGSSISLNTSYTLANGNKISLNSESQLMYTQVGRNNNSSYFTFRVHDTMGQIATDTFAVNVTAPPSALLSLSTLTASLSTLNATSVSGTFATASGGAGNNATSIINSNNIVVAASGGAYALSHGSLTISGNSFTYMPSNGFFGTESFNYKVTDNNGAFVSENISINVHAPTPVLASNASAQTVKIGDSVTIQLPTVSNANGDTVTYSLSSETFARGLSLPAGLTLNTETGIISGTPTTLGTTPISLKYTATDSGGTVTSDAFNFVVNAPTPILLSATDAQAVLVNSDVSISLPTVNNAHGDTVTYDLAEGYSLPVGLNFNNTPAGGNISGTPTVFGTTNLQYTATDSGGTVTSNAFDFVVQTAVALSVTSGSYSTGFNTPYSGTFATASGGAGTYTYSIIDFSQNNFSLDTTGQNTITLPGGGSLTIDGTKLSTAPAFTYTPGSVFSGTDTFTYKVSDALSNNSETISMNVRAQGDLFGTNLTLTDSDITNENSVFSVISNTDNDNGSTLTLSVSDSQTETLSSNVTANVAIEKTGPGTVVLTGTNAQKSTTISEGQLSISSSDNMGTGEIKFNGGVLNLTQEMPLINNMNVNGNTDSILYLTQDSNGSALDVGLYGNFTGSGNLLISGSSYDGRFSRVTLSGDLSGLSGTVTIDSSIAFDNTSDGASTPANLNFLIGFGATVPFSKVGSVNTVRGAALAAQNKILFHGGTVQMQSNMTGINAIVNPFDLAQVESSNNLGYSGFIDLNGNNAEISGAIIGQNPLVIGNTSNTQGMLTLSGMSSNYTDTILNAGAMLKANNSGALGTHELYLNGGVLKLNMTGTVRLSQAVNLSANTVIDTGGADVVFEGMITDYRIGNSAQSGYTQIGTSGYYINSTSGAFGLSFVGGGSVTFSGSNSYTGYTIFNSNTVLFGSVPMSSSSYPFITVDSDVTYTEEGRFSGPSALVKKGPGIFKMANTGTGINRNNYIGGTIIKDGELAVSLTGQIPSENPTTTDAITIDASIGGSPVLGVDADNVSIPNSVHFTTAGAIDTHGHSGMKFTGTLDGAGNVIKLGNGEAVFESTNNTQSGETDIKGGTLAVNNLGATTKVNLISGGLRMMNTTISNLMGRVINLGGRTDS